MSNRVISFESQLQGVERAKAWLRLLTTSPSERRNLLRKVGRKAKTLSNQRRRSQQDIDGQKWAPRKQGRKKMMKNFGKHLKAIANSSEAMLTFFNVGIGKMAYAHHHGIGQVFRLGSPEAKKEQQKEQKSTNQAAEQTGRKGPATKAQAKRLVDSGEFRIGKRRTRGGHQRNGGKGRIPSMRWVRQNLTNGQAGAIIRTLGINKKSSGKNRWFMPRPARPWLGMNRQETNDMVNFILDELTADLT